MPLCAFFDTLHSPLSTAPPNSTAPPSQSTTPSPLPTPAVLSTAGLGRGDGVVVTDSSALRRPTGRKSKVCGGKTSRVNTSRTSENECCGETAKACPARSPASTTAQTVCFEGAKHYYSTPAGRYATGGHESQAPQAAQNLRFFCGRSIYARPPALPRSVDARVGDWLYGRRDRPARDRPPARPRSATGPPAIGDFG